MRWGRWSVVLAGVILGGGAIAAAVWAAWGRGAARLPAPLPVSSADHEIAWINNATNGDAWSLFVIGMKRTEMPVNGVPSGLSVDDTNAFPRQSTAVPELVVSKAGIAGKLRFRWYKVAAEAPIDAWTQALAVRDPAPLAVIGGWTSDRARELAQSLAARSSWRGDRPLFLITTATVDLDTGDPDDPGGFAPVPDQKNLIDVYPRRSFRFCFSNTLMVRAVTDYVLHDPTLRPGPARWPELQAVVGAAAGPWALLVDVAELAHRPTVFPLEWQDDPYSADLYNQFREHLYQALGGMSSPPRMVRDPAFSIPYSIGGFSRPNAGEAAAVREILRSLPPPRERSVLVIPTVTAPARRVLLTLSERMPQAGRRLVAVTGDGLSANTFYRDAQWAWPARSIPIPIVLFAHFNPFGWDAPDDTTPPRGYRLEPKSATEEVLLDTTMGRMIADAAFIPAAEGRPAHLVDRADEAVTRLRSRPDKFFDDRGNRRGMSGEYVVVVRPTVRYGDTTPGVPKPEAVLEAYRRPDDGSAWARVRAIPVYADKTDDRSVAE